MFYRTIGFAWLAALPASFMVFSHQILPASIIEKCPAPTVAGNWKIAWTDVNGIRYTGTVKITGDRAEIHIECAPCGGDGKVNQSGKVVLIKGILKIQETQIDDFEGESFSYRPDTFELKWNCTRWVGAWDDGGNDPTNNVVMSR